MSGVGGAGGSDFSPPGDDADVEQLTAAVVAPAEADTLGIEETAATIEGPPANEEAAAVAGDEGLPDADVDAVVPGADDRDDAAVAESVDDGDDAAVAESVDDGDDAAVAESVDDGDDAAVAESVDDGDDAAVAESVDDEDDAVVAEGPDGTGADADEAYVAGDLGTTLAGKTRAPSGPAPQAAPTGGLGPGAETERHGHQVRRYRMGVSGAALALAWARQENAPNGASVLVEREVSPLGRLGRMWATAPESTLSCAIVLRPPLSVEEADATWLLAGVAAAEGAEVASGRTLATWWPDLVVDVETGEQVAALKVEIQLGPGKVRSAVASIRIDLDKLGVGPEGRDAVFEAVLAALDRNSESLGDGAAGVAAAYEGRCGLLGRRVKLRLLPKGETRGLARSVDRSARLELESATGMVQKIAIDNLRELEAV